MLELALVSIFWPPLIIQNQNLATMLATKIGLPVGPCLGKPT